MSDKFEIRKVHSDQHAMEKNRIKLEEDTESCLTNLRFADDARPTTGSFLNLKKMMTDVKRSIERHGPRIHHEKTNIFPSKSNNGEKEEDITCDGLMQICVRRLTRTR